MTQRLSLFTKIKHLPGKFGDRIARHGFVDTARWMVSLFTTELRERRLGIRTATYVEPGELGYGEEYHGYEPIGYENFDAIMRHFRIHPEQDVFLDYGCGKGRALVLAATHPFRRVIGVEYSAELCRIAKQQLDRARPKLKCHDVEVVCADACHYEVPPDVTTVFFWNSFTGTILEQTLEKLRQSIARTPRPVRLFYLIPEGEPDRVQQLNWLHERTVIPTRFWTGVTILSYRCQLP